MPYNVTCWWTCNRCVREYFVFKKWLSYKFIYHYTILQNPINPLLLELCFPSIVLIYSKTWSYSLPTHRLSTHRNFSLISSYFKIEIFAKCCSWTMLCSKGLIEYEKLYWAIHNSVEHITNAAKLFLTLHLDLNNTLDS